MTPPTLRNVPLADLNDVGRLLALHQQAIARGWLQGGEAAQLNVAAASVHARRVGEAPCRLFVALLGLAAAAVRKPTVAQYTLSFKYLQVSKFAKEPGPSGESSRHDVIVVWAFRPQSTDRHTAAIAATVCPQASRSQRSRLPLEHGPGYAGQGRVGKLLSSVRSARSEGLCRLAFL